MLNVITAYLHGREPCTTETVYQYNSGMRMQILGKGLPDVYEVDFANSITGNSITQIASGGVVSVPDEFFVPGSIIHAWVVIVGVDYVVTRKHIMIPISIRAIRTNVEPTPSQQSALDEAIAALNDAVDAAETAITHYPTVIDGYWCVWDVVAGEYVSTGVQAQGPQGIPGKDGTSPTASVSKSGNTATITITDMNGTTTAQVTDGTNGTPGTDGQDGVSPAVSISTITGGHSVTITDADHPGGQSFNVMDGTDGSPGTPGADGVGVPAGGTAGQVLTKSSGTDYDTEWTTPNPVVSVSGTTPAITALPGVRYICGEVATLDITFPASGIVDVVFESGSTPTVLTITPPTGVTVRWANGFDPTSLEANTTYEINIADGLGVAGQWT